MTLGFLMETTGRNGRMGLSLSEMGKTDDGAGLEKEDQYLSFGYVKCQFSIRQINNEDSCRW